MRLLLTIGKIFLQVLSILTRLGFAGFPFVSVFGLTIETASGREVAFFYALDADLKAFRDGASNSGTPISIGHHTIQRFDLEGNHVYATKTGSGAVESAVSTSVLLTRFKCNIAISIGPVGALDDEVKQGAWYKVGKIISYQKGSWQKNGFGSTPFDHGEDAQDSTPAAEVPFAVPNLFLQASAQPPITVASGEIFVASSSYRNQLHSQTGARAVDMNLFGIASACFAAHVPLFSWRIASDRADDDANTAFRSFAKNYNGAGGTAVLEIIRKLKPDLNSPDSYPQIKSFLKSRTGDAKSSTQ